MSMEFGELTRRIEHVHASEAPTVIQLDGGGEPESRVAVLPSAYNPPTRAHLELLRVAGEAEGVGSVAALLTTRNVVKGLFGASLAHRAGMLLALCQEDSGFTVFVTNQARIADQAKLLGSALAGAGVDMVVGYDTLVRVFDPRYYATMHEELAVFFAEHRLIASNREGHGAKEIRGYLERPEVRLFAGRILVSEISDEAAALSSTSAREAIAAGREPNELPSRVRAYVERHGLYEDA